jgi:hypothetical protein
MPTPETQMPIGAVKDRGTNRQVGRDPFAVVLSSGGSSVLADGVGCLGGAEGEASGHVELDFAVWQDVCPEQGDQAAEILGGEDAGPFGFGEDVLDHERVDVDERCLQDVQGEHPELLLVAAVGGELAALAVEDHGVDAVPRLDQGQAFVDLTLQLRCF